MLDVTSAVLNYLTLLNWVSGTFTKTRSCTQRTNCHQVVDPLDMRSLTNLIS